MAPSGFSPLVHRALVAVAVFTFASWVIIAAALLAWAPGRSLAAGAVSRVAHAAATVPAAEPLAAAALSNLVMPCGSVSEFRDDDAGPNGFAWGLFDGEGSLWADGADQESFTPRWRTGEPRFWFRDGGESYVVRDPELVAAVREAVQPLRELGREMGTLGAEMGRHGARIGRLGGQVGAMSARMALIDARLARGSVSAERRSEVEASMRELRAQLTELRAELDREQSQHGNDQRVLSHRMSELSARQHELLKQVRTRVRELAERARREGKAERPHANA